MKSVFVVALTWGIVGVSVPATATLMVTPVERKVAARAFNNFAVPNNVESSSSDTGNSAPLTLNSSAEAVNTPTVVSSITTATWSSATFGNGASSWGGVRDRTGFLATAGAPLWSYSFEIDRPTVFTLVYNIRRLAFGLPEFATVNLLQFSPSGFVGTMLPNAGPTDVTGSAELLLSGAGVHRLELENTFRTDTLATVLGPLAQSGGIDYTWSLTAAPDVVPEPASWMLLIAGFGMTGAALRRSRGAFAGAAG